MYTIMMNTDKRLIQTVVTTLYQNENLVDKLKFMIPRTYEDLSIQEFRVTLCYTTPSGNEESEEIVLSDEVYKNKWICGYLPIGSKLTRAAGDVILSLIFTDNNRRILKSGETTIKIRAIDKDIPGTPDNPIDPDIPPTGDDSNPEGFEVVEF